VAVRRESVRLELDDHFSKGMLAAAAATKTLEGSLKDLDGTAVRTSKSVNRVTRDNDSLSSSAVRGSAAIDKYSGRMGILLKVAATLGPALVPIGAVGIAGIAGLASQLGFAAVGMSSLVVAAQGVGTALDAVNKAHLVPTAENLQAARDALEGLDPAAKAFVARFQEFRPVLADIRNSAAAGWFPGLTEALDSFEKVAPKVGEIFKAVGTTGGNLFAEAAEALAGPEWSEFMDFVAREAPPAFEALGRSVGNVASGMADLWMAFDPVNDDVSSWLVDASRGFAEWSDGLSETAGFQQFVSYLRENGPLVAEAVGSIGDALVQIVEAAAPLGGPTLHLITGIADAIAAIADSPLGTPLLGVASAFSAISLATRGLSGLAGVVGTFERLGPAAIKAQKGLAGIATKATPLLAASAAIVALGNALGDAFGAKLELSDLDRDLQAIANGATTDALSRIADDLLLVNDRIPVAGQLAEGLNEAITGFGLLGNTGLDNAVDNLDAVDQALARLVESGNAEQAELILNNIAAALLGALPGSSISPAYIDELKGTFDAYSTAADNAAAANGPLSDSLRDTGDAAGLTQAQINGLTAAMVENMNAAIGAFDAVTAYREALKAARVQGDKNNAGIQGNSKAALENRNLITGLASAWNNQSEAVRNNVEKYREARRSFVETATAMGVPIDRAIALADAMLGIPEKVVAGLEVEDRATAKIAAVQRLIDYYGLTKAAGQALLRDLASGKISTVQQLINKYGLTKAEAQALLRDAASGKLQGLLGLLDRADGYHAESWTTHTITTVLRTVRDPGDTAGGPPALGPASADGGTVPGRRFPYADRVLLPAAPSEEIVSNRYGQADHFRRELKRMNAWRPGMSSRASERPMSSTGSRGGTVRHVIEVKVVGGEFDLTKAKAQIHGIARTISRDEIDQDASFQESQR